MAHHATRAPESSMRRVERIGPASGALVSSEPAHDLATCRQFAARAAAAFPRWSRLPALDRAALLAQVADAIEAQSDALIAAMTDEIGASRHWARHNVRFAARILRETGSLVAHLDSETLTGAGDGVTSRVERQACGVCLGIAPWNAPLILGVRAVAAPLLCGNTVILKGSEIAPRTFRLLGDAFAAGGIAPEILRIVLNQPEDSEAVVEALIAMPVVRRVSFTGSTRVGRRVAEICARHLKRPLLELGGQAPMIVLDDADLDVAAAAAVQGGYLNQGQICISTERLIVSNRIADAFLAKLEDRRAALRLGDPSREDVDIGPVIGTAAAERLAGLIGDAMAKGAALVGGGGIRGTYAEPTLIDGVEPGMRLYREEAFGPILSVTRFDSDLEAVTIANDSEFGLSAAIFSGDIARAEAVAGQVHSGICHINRPTVDDDPLAPFGGVKASGFGRFGGRWALDEFTELRWITSRDRSDMRGFEHLPYLDYSDAAYAADPFLWLADKAKTAKIARSDRGIEILDYDLCRAFLLDRTLGTDHGNLVERMGLPESRALDFKRRMLLTQNRGETRQRLRRALTSLIGPKQAPEMRGRIAGVVARLVEGFGSGPVDLKHDFADLVPGGVYCAWVDAPASEARFIADMSEKVLAIFRRDPALTPGIVAAYDTLFDYVGARLAERRGAMGDDFLSDLIRLNERGELSAEELEDFAVMLIEASTDNTAAQIAIAIDRLTAMPDIWSAIARDPALAAPALREVMRLWPRSISTSRTALEPTGLGGIAIPKGTSIFASFGAAHRQPDIFTDPHRFDMERPPMPPHMNFGGGAFSCLGQFVAVIEVEEAIAQLARRYPRLTVTGAERDFTAMFHSIRGLHVEL